MYLICRGFVGGKQSYEGVYAFAGAQLVCSVLLMISLRQTKINLKLLAFGMCRNKVPVKEKRHDAFNVLSHGPVRMESRRIKGRVNGKRFRLGEAKL